MNATRTCIIDGCDRPQHGRGACRSHYMKAWRGQIVLPEYEIERPGVAERFWAKVDRGGDNDCWLWKASKFPNGYGQFGHEGAHRVSLRLAGVDIPDGHHVDHLCRRVACVNPRHLEPVTPSENSVRGYGPSIAASRVIESSLTRTHCAQGHELTEANTYRAPSHPTWRVCRACKRSRQRATTKG